MLTVRPYRESDQDAVVALWHECRLVRPWNDPVKDIRRKLGFQRDLFLVGLVDRRMVATVMVRALGCPKISLQIRRSNAEVVEFYRSLGYAEDDVVSMGKRLEED